MTLARLQSSLDSIMAEILRARPGLSAHPWSHSLGEALEWDGWTLGFRLLGLAQPILCHISLSSIHTQLRVDEAYAEWEGELDKTISIWRSFEVEIDPELAELRKELRRALKTGPVEESLTVRCHMYSFETPGSPNYLLVRDELSRDETAIYQAWFTWLRRQNRIQPIRISSWFPSQHHPHAPSQIQALAQQLGPGWPHPEALVKAIYSADYVPPQLLGPGLEVVEPDPLGMGQEWGEFYARHPRAHGCMSISSIGIVSEHAVLLLHNTSGWLVPGGKPAEKVERLGEGGYCASFQRFGSSWQFQQLQRLPLSWLTQTIFLGALWLHYAERGPLQILETHRESGALRLRLELGGKQVQLVDQAYLLRQAPWDCPDPLVVMPYLYDIEPVVQALESVFVGV
jgi:hypothetical protein